MRMKHRSMSNHQLSQLLHVRLTIVPSCCLLREAARLERGETHGGNVGIAGCQQSTAQVGGVHDCNLRDIHSQSLHMHVIKSNLTFAEIT